MSLARTGPTARERFALFAECLLTGVWIALAALPLVTYPAALAAGARHLRRHLAHERGGWREFTADFRTVHPAGLALAATTAAAVEGMLRLALHERDARLRRRYEDGVLASPATQCLVAPSGRPLTRPPR